ncbi:unnamed protein product, partial [Mesorhabditis belari]|uniref:NADPH--cytochrome P450 reductase n=1 Tax=Mesorhabditis belari TaxID=2138241 RepID=A0AAF3E9A0_9BILA
MLDWFLSQFDTVDVVVLVALAIGGLYFYFKMNANNKSSFAPKSTPVVPVRQQREQGFIARMKNEGRQVLILYGSQTGTAEELSGRLAKDLHRYTQKALVLDPEEIDVDDLTRLPEVENVLLVLCVATYGEGDPTDNAQQLFEFIKNTDADFKGVKYAVFGLGNKTYEHFNEVGKIFDTRLEELGAERVYTLGLGDDDANLEEDFMRWREGFLPHVAQEFAWELNTDAETQRQYRLELLGEENQVTLFKGEYGRLGAFERQRPPFDLKNPFLASIMTNRELHSEESDRSCRHVELALEGSRIRYEAGDHVALFPTNDPSAVAAVLERLDTDSDQAFRLINTDEESSKRNPFPCPTTLRTAFTHYVDICAPLKSHVLKALAEFCTDEKEKEKLKLLSTPSEEGLKEYASYIVKGRRSLVDVLRAFPSCRPPFDYLLELLPRLQARYYSIASSPKHSENAIHVTAVVTTYSIADEHDERFIKGVCTNWLKEKNTSEKVPIFVRKSQMRLPHRTTTPVILIGPGTGLAPFRGFIQERKWHKDQGKEVGDIMLFFGCRDPTKDYIYKDELEGYRNAEVITDLHVAFSRIQGKPKVYVQHLMWEQKERVWALLEQGAHIYVCGDARNMAKDVQNCLLRILREVGGQSEEEAIRFFKDLERQRRYQADVWS